MVQARFVLFNENVVVRCDSHILKLAVSCLLDVQDSFRMELLRSLWTMNE